MNASDSMNASANTTGAAQTWYVRTKSAIGLNVFFEHFRGNP